MSKRRKLGENEGMAIKSHAINKNESVAPPKSITTNVKMDGKKATNSSQRSTDEILAASNHLQLASTETDEKKGRNRSAEDINLAEQSSDIKESDLTKNQKMLQDVSIQNEKALEMSEEALKAGAYIVFREYQKVIDADEKFNAIIPEANKQSSVMKESNMTEKEIEEVLESIEEATRVISKAFICKPDSNCSTGDISEIYGGRLNSLFESRRDCYEFLRSQHPELVEYTKIYIHFKAEDKCYQKLSDILKSSNEMSISEKKVEICKVGEELKNIGKHNKEQFAAAIRAADEITPDLEKDDENKVRTKDNEGSVDHIHTTTYSIQKVTVEKDGNEFTGIIQETENSPRNVESVYDDESQMKTKDGVVESMCKAKDSSDLQHTNEMVNVSPILTFQRSKSVQGVKKCRRRNIYLKSFKKNPRLLSSEKAMMDNAEAVEALKEQANQINDIIIEMQKVAMFEKGSKDYESSTEYINVAGKSPRNATEHKKKENKCKEDIERSNDDIKDLNADTEMLRLSQEMKHCKINDGKGKTLHPSKLKNVPIGYFKPNSKPFLLFPLEENPVAGTESHEEATDTTNEGGKNEEVAKTEELDHEPSEMDLVLEKNADIHFEFETDGNKLIFSGGQNYNYSAEEKQDIKFEFKDVEVSFTGNQIFVSTPNSEFDIFVRKSEPINSTNEETQTETFPNIQ